jgi:hypothetical protein
MRATELSPLLKTVTADRTVMGEAVRAIVITVIMWRGFAARAYTPVYWTPHESRRSIFR